MHQVVTTGVERTSFVFFYYPNFNAKLPATTPSLPGGSAVAAEDAVGIRTDSPGIEGGTSIVDIPGDVREGAGVGEAGTHAAADAAAAAAGGEVGATAAAAKKGAVASIGSYNTLLDLKRGHVGGSGGGQAEGDADESFGQYLLRKWGAVFRE